jgi:hypothetical protein
MIGYGIAEDRRGLLDWSWARQRLERAHNYFLATTCPDGRPHLMPIWGVWLHDAFYFSTGRASRKARNLAANPACVITAENAAEAVIVEGVAQEVGAAAFRKAGGPYKKKYGWKLDPALGPLFLVRPTKAFGFIEKDELFTKTATRWEF